jgi:predicted branched-subunit amino acid permease
MDLRASRRQLIVDGLGLLVSIIGFGLVYGLAARAAGFSPIEAGSMSLIVFAGASQFAAVGYVAAGLYWPLIMVLTAFVNSRHFLYSAALAPYLADHPRPLRAVMAHFLTDEAFALSIAHFRRIGRGDLFGYMWAALVVVYVPWNLATLAGVLIGGAIPDPRQLGLDVIFPAAMAGLAVGLIDGRRDIVAALAGVLIGIAVGLAFDPAAGIVAGGMFGPVVAMIAVRGTAR